MLRSLFILAAVLNVSHSFSDVGKWDLPLTGGDCSFSISKSLFKDSKLIIVLHCGVESSNVSVHYHWSPFSCSPDYFHYFEQQIVHCSALSDRVERSATEPGNASAVFQAVKAQTEVHYCHEGQSIILYDEKSKQSSEKTKGGGATDTKKTPAVLTVDKEGVYELEMVIISSPTFKGSVQVEMLAPSGYLSAAMWPLLVFFGVMCAVYTIQCALWLLVCGLQWRDLLRIQYWIGGVAILGMIESATYYAVYSAINNSGYFSVEAYMFAEWVSVAKRALARMLVIIVSLGFGIVKPRLGSALQRVVGIGVLWGVLAAINAWLRLHHHAGDSNRKLLYLPRLGPALQRVVGTGVLWGVLAAINAWLRLHHHAGDSNRILLLSEAPLSLLDSAICWWVFVSLAHTMRTLQLRRNTIKLSLYRHFTNTLIFAVISSVVFMLYSIKSYRVLDCIKDWKEVWMDEAYWHILFASVLTVIMVLWRPTNNNQRYAFTPLLDNAEDDEDEEDQFVNDAYGVKMRSPGFSSDDKDSPLEPGSNSLDSDLRWVEENIPTSSLPLLDSDEEIINTKFEVSKMQ